MNEENNFSEMLKSYKKIVQVPFEKYKELTDEDTKETFQYMVHKMANDDIKIFEKLELKDKLIKLQEIELDQYKNNWGELKKELKTAYSELFEHELINGREVIENILNEMKELEENK